MQTQGSNSITLSTQEIQKNKAGLADAGADVQNLAETLASESNASVSEVIEEGNAQAPEDLVDGSFEVVEAVANGVVSVSSFGLL